MGDVAALVLAAGAATRFRAAAGERGPATKLVARLDGKPLVRHVVEAALGSRARPVIVVTGHAREEVEAALAGLSVRFVHNPDFATGLASSLRVGVAALPTGAEGALVLLGDMPRVSAALIDRLISAREADPTAKAVVPTFGGQRGNPALVARALFPAVATNAGDVGARKILAAAGDDVVEVVVDDEAVTFDVDTPDMLGNQGTSREA